MPSSVSVSELSNTFEGLCEQKRQQDGIRSQLAAANIAQNNLLDKHTACETQIAAIEDTLEKARRLRADLKNMLEASAITVGKLTGEVEALPDLAPQIAAVKQKIADVEAINAVAEEARQTAAAHHNSEACLEDARA